MTEPTYKQLQYARSLKIATDGLSKEELSKAIDEKTGKKPKAEGAIQQGRHDVVLTRLEKPHSFEFGKATARHKIYYDNVEELKFHMRALKDAGLIEDETTVEKI